MRGAGPVAYRIFHPTRIVHYHRKSLINSRTIADREVDIPHRQAKSI